MECKHAILELHIHHKRRTQHQLLRQSKLLRLIWLQHCPINTANRSTSSPVQPTISVPCCTAAHMVSTTSSASESNRILTCNVGTSCLSQRLHTTSASQTKQTSTSHSASALPYQRNSSHNKVSNWNTSPLTSSSVPTPTPEPCFSAARMVSTTSSVSGLPRIQKFNSGTSYSSQRSQMSLSSQTKQSSTSQSILKSPQTENNKKCSIQWW